MKGIKGGTFVMSRGWFDHPAFATQPYSEREAWAWLIAEAEWKPQKRKSGRMIMEVQRGSCTFSLRFLAKKWKWSHMRVSRFLNKLAACDMIVTTTVTGQNLITLLNYGTYQNAPGENVTRTQKSRYKPNSRIPTSIEEVGSARARATPTHENAGRRKNGYETDRSTVAWARRYRKQFEAEERAINAVESTEEDGSVCSGAGGNVTRLLPPGRSY